MKRLSIHNIRVNVSGITQILLCLYFIISIFEPYLNGLIGSVTKYYMFFVMFIILWRDGFRLKLRRISIVYIIWLCFKILTLLWSESFEIPKLHFISQVGMVLFMTVLLSNPDGQEARRRFLDTYWLASAVMGVLSLFFAKTYMDVSDARQVLVIMGVEVDPNNQAALLLVGMAISVGNILYEKRWVIPSLTCLGINIYTCFSTSSRAALVTIAVVVVCCVLYTPEKMKFRAILKRLMIVGLAVAAIYYVTVRFLPEASFDRLFDFETYEGGSEREVLWRITWEQYTKDPLTVLLGTGWGTIFNYLGGRAVHNTFLTLLVDTGLVGTVLFMVPMVIATVQLLKRKQATPILLLVAQMIPSFFIDAINKRFFWNALLILFMYAIPEFEKDDNMKQLPIQNHQ